MATALDEIQNGLTAALTTARETTSVVNRRQWLNIADEWVLLGEARATLAGPSGSSVSELRKLAELALDAAKRTEDPIARFTWLNIAGRWTELVRDVVSELRTEKEISEIPRGAAPKRTLH